MSALLENSEPLRNVPSGTTITPPPSAAARSMTRCIASVCNKVESFFTPYDVMTYLRPSVSMSIRDVSLNHAGMSVPSGSCRPRLLR